MGNFGEDLRMERLSRGIALEDITAVTKISQRHLIALEQERFRLLPGGILSKGIVRGYAGALGLDQHDWTERFLKPIPPQARCSTTTAAGWTSPPTWARRASSAMTPWRCACAGSARSCCCWWWPRPAFLTLRYYGLRAGWWTTLLPMEQVQAACTPCSSAVHAIRLRYLLVQSLI